MNNQQELTASLLSRREQFSEQLLHWWDHDHQEHPWRRNKDPYAIWIAEVMLQQTQITTVIPYYERWMTDFPDVKSLACATLDDVLRHWQGLGYYSRARNLHKAARIVNEQFGGRLPADVAELRELPGIGRYTAGAIASIAFGRQTAVLDGNIIRVLSRLIDLNLDVTKTVTKNLLWKLAADLVPERRSGDYNEALMELGQRICLPAQPICSTCPCAAYCLAKGRGTQYERPVRPTRKTPPHIDVVAGVIWRVDAAPDAEFLIARRPLDTMLGGLWEFPGGKVEDGESYEDALKREILEELDLAIHVGNYLGHINHAYSHFRITLHVLSARLAGGNPKNIGVTDHAWVTRNELQRYAFAVTDRRIIENHLHLAY